MKIMLQVIITNGLLAIGYSRVSLRNSSKRFSLLLNKTTGNIKKLPFQNLPTESDHLKCGYYKKFLVNFLWASEDLFVEN